MIEMWDIAIICVDPGVVFINKQIYIYIEMYNVYVYVYIYIYIYSWNVLRTCPFFIMLNVFKKDKATGTLQSQGE